MRQQSTQREGEREEETSEKLKRKKGEREIRLRRNAGRC